MEPVVKVTRGFALGFLTPFPRGRTDLDSLRNDGWSA